MLPCLRLQNSCEELQFLQFFAVNTPEQDSDRVVVNNKKRAFTNEVDTLQSNPEIWSVFERTFNRRYKPHVEFQEIKSQLSPSCDCEIDHDLTVGVFRRFVNVGEKCFKESLIAKEPDVEMKLYYRDLIDPNGNGQPPPECDHAMPSLDNPQEERIPNPLMAPSLRHCVPPSLVLHGWKKITQANRREYNYRVVFSDQNQQFKCELVPPLLYCSCCCDISNTADQSSSDPWKEFCNVFIQEFGRGCLRRAFEEHRITSFLRPLTPELFEALIGFGVEHS